MAAKTQVCEILDLTRPEIPPRSRLYHLEPIGVGTPYVESLTSYIARLAQAHCVLPRALVRRVIWPLFGVSFGAEGDYNMSEYARLNRLWESASMQLNGTIPMVGKWAQIVERLTLNDDLHVLTMLAWADVVSYHRLLRRTRAWCPECYEEWRSTGHAVYDPLLWALRVVEVCTRHSRYLEVQCPHEGCRQSTSLLSQLTRPGHCSSCGRWLGICPTRAGREGIPPPENELEWQGWIADTVGEMLACTFDLSCAPSRNGIMKSISVCSEQTAQGSVRTMARNLSVHDSTLRLWKSGGRIPMLDTLLYICYCLGTRPLSLILGEATASPFFPIHPPVPRPRYALQDRLGAVEVGQIQKALDAILASSEAPFPSLSEVARRLGHDRVRLRWYFPEECTEISARYKAGRRTRGENNILRIRGKVRRTVLELHAQGIYPSYKAVARALGVTLSYTRSPHFRDARREAMKEIGLESQD